MATTPLTLTGVRKDLATAKRYLSRVQNTITAPRGGWENFHPVLKADRLGRAATEAVTLAADLRVIADRLGTLAALAAEEGRR